MKVKRVFFIGPRATGKSTLGKLLAKDLGVDFLDLDRLIEKRYSSSIFRIVQEFGWDYFRRIEHEVLKEICKMSFKSVVATGGGVVLFKENRRILKKEGVVFYIKTPVDILIKRLKASFDFTSRPPLTELSLEEEVNFVLKKRERFYVEIAHYILDGSKKPDELLEKIKNLLSYKGMV